MRIPIIIIITATLAGCATTETVWEKSGASNHDFYVDQGQCKAQGAAVPGMALMQVVIVYQNCMAGKGWYLVEREKR